MEYVIGVSSGASALSRYIDSLLNNKIEKSFASAMPMDLEGFAKYPDFLAFILVLIITAFMVMGVKESTLLNKIFTLLNIVVIVFIFVCGIIKSDLSNWRIKPDVKMKKKFIFEPKF